MALLEKLVKISNYTGLYLQDSNCAFSNQKEITTNDIQKKSNRPTLSALDFMRVKNLYMNNIRLRITQKQLKKFVMKYPPKEKLSK